MDSCWFTVESFRLTQGGRRKCMQYGSKFHHWKNSVGSHYWLHSVTLIKYPVHIYLTLVSHQISLKGYIDARCSDRQTVEDIWMLFTTNYYGNWTNWWFVWRQLCTKSVNKFGTIKDIFHIWTGLKTTLIFTNHLKLRLKHMKFAWCLFTGSGAHRW